MLRTPLSKSSATSAPLAPETVVNREEGEAAGQRGGSLGRSAPTVAEPTTAIRGDGLATAEAAVLYGDDADAVRVRVVRTVQHSRSEIVRIPALSLVRQSGQTAIQPTIATLANGLGLDIRTAPSNHAYSYETEKKASGPSKGAIVGGPPHDADGDHRAPRLDLRIDPTPGALKPNERFDSVSVDLGTADSNLDGLGVWELSIASADPKSSFQADWRTKRRAPGVVPRKPFALLVKVTKRWTETLDTFEATIPVEPAR